MVCNCAITICWKPHGCSKQGRFLSAEAAVITNAGLQGQEKGGKDTEGSGTAGTTSRLFAAIVTPAA